MNTQNFVTGPTHTRNYERNSKKLQSGFQTQTFCTRTIFTSHAGVLFTTVIAPTNQPLMAIHFVRQIWVFLLQSSWRTQCLRPFNFQNCSLQSNPINFTREEFSVRQYRMRSKICILYGTEVNLSRMFHKYAK